MGTDYFLATIAKSEFRDHLYNATIIKRLGVPGIQDRDSIKPNIENTKIYYALKGEDIDGLRLTEEAQKRMADAKAAVEAAAKAAAEAIAVGAGPRPEPKPTPAVEPVVAPVPVIATPSAPPFTPPAPALPVPLAPPTADSLAQAVITILQDAARYANPEFDDEAGTLSFTVKIEPVAAQAGGKYRRRTRKQVIRKRKNRPLRRTDIAVTATA